MKLLTIFLVLSQVVANGQRPMKPEDKFAKYSSRFRAIECKSTDNSTAYFTKCYVKSYSRNFQSLNFGIQTLKNLSSIFVHILTSYRYGNIYREVIDTKLINWCQMMDGVDQNLFFKLILDSIRDSAPGIFHKCPYGGLFEFYNITVTDEVVKKVSIFPDGQYRYNITISTKPDRIILVMRIDFEIKSPLKTSFG